MSQLSAAPSNTVNASPTTASGSDINNNNKNNKNNSSNGHNAREPLPAKVSHDWAALLQSSESYVPSFRVKAAAAAAAATAAANTSSSLSSAAGNVCGSGSEGGGGGSRSCKMTSYNNNNGNNNNNNNNNNNSNNVPTRKKSNAGRKNNNSNNSNNNVAAVGHCPSQPRWGASRANRPRKIRAGPLSNPKTNTNQHDHHRNNNTKRTNCFFPPSGMPSAPFTPFASNPPIATNSTTAVASIPTCYPAAAPATASATATAAVTVPYVASVASVASVSAFPRMAPWVPPPAYHHLPPQQTSDTRTNEGEQGLENTKSNGNTNSNSSINSNTNDTARRASCGVCGSYRPYASYPLITPNSHLARHALSLPCDSTATTVTTTTHSNITSTRAITTTSNDNGSGATCVDALTAEVRDFVSYASLTPLERRARDRCVAHVRAVASRLWGPCTLPCTPVSSSSCVSVSLSSASSVPTSTSQSAMSSPLSSASPSMERADAQRGETEMAKTKKKEEEEEEVAVRTSHRHQQQHTQGPARPATNTNTSPYKRHYRLASRPFALESVQVYGSYALGLALPQSDVDLALSFARRRARDDTDDDYDERVNNNTRDNTSLRDNNARTARKALAMEEEAGAEEEEEEEDINNNIGFCVERLYELAAALLRAPYKNFSAPSDFSHSRAFQVPPPSSAHHTSTTTAAAAATGRRVAVTYAHVRDSCQNPVLQLEFAVPCYAGDDKDYHSSSHCNKTTSHLHNDNATTTTNAVPAPADVDDRDTLVMVSGEKILKDSSGDLTTNHSTDNDTNAPSESAVPSALGPAGAATETTVTTTECPVAVVMIKCDVSVFPREYIAETVRNQLAWLRGGDGKYKNGEAVNGECHRDTTTTTTTTITPTVSADHVKCNNNNSNNNYRRQHYHDDDHHSTNDIHNTTNSDTSNSIRSERGTVSHTAMEKEEENDDEEEEVRRVLILLTKSALRQWGLHESYRGGVSSTAVYSLARRFLLSRRQQQQQQQEHKQHKQQQQEEEEEEQKQESGQRAQGGGIDYAAEDRNGKQQQQLRQQHTHALSVASSASAREGGLSSGPSCNDTDDTDCDDAGESEEAEHTEKEEREGRGEWTMGQAQECGQPAGERNPATDTDSSSAANAADADAADARTCKRVTAKTTTAACVGDLLLDFWEYLSHDAFLGGYLICNMFLPQNNNIYCNNNNNNNNNDDSEMEKSGANNAEAQHHSHASSHSSSFSSAGITPSHTPPPPPDPVSTGVSDGSGGLYRDLTAAAAAVGRTPEIVLRFRQARGALLEALCRAQHCLAARRRQQQHNGNPQQLQLQQQQQQQQCLQVRHRAEPKTDAAALSGVDERNSSDSSDGGNGHMNSYTVTTEDTVEDCVCRLVPPSFLSLVLTDPRRPALPRYC